ncbi:MAG TPA: Uma2 family endonuclease [Candidatus Didemnitutus sp.]|nr:Uma2 family endonuclease [Candidatus Didemnitutus sp.]
MSEGYEELIGGQVLKRRALTAEHERLVAKLHSLVEAAIPPNSTLRVLPPRSALQLAEEHTVCPDLAIVRMPPVSEDEPNPQLYLVGEVLHPADHHTDTVVKKQLWADRHLPRLWMIDPRYRNIEVYGCGEYGFTLLNILANHDKLTDPFLLGFAHPVRDLFADA